MRKGRVAGILIYLALFLLLLGCSSEGGDSAGVKSNSSGQQSENISQWNGPERQADLWGKVKTIRGNELTVFKVDNTLAISSEQEREAQREKMQSLSPEERAKAREERLKVSSETVDIIIPVGTPVIATGNAAGEAREADIASIKQGDLLKLWLEDTSNNGEAGIAEFVQINQGGSGQ